MPGRVRAPGPTVELAPHREVSDLGLVDSLDSPLRYTCPRGRPGSAICSVGDAASDAVLGAAPTRHWRAYGRPTAPERHFLEVATIGWPQSPLLDPCPVPGPG